MKKELQAEYQYRPTLISKPYREGIGDENVPVQDRLFNKANEYEMKKEEMRRNQVDSNWTFRPKLAKMTDQILITRSIFSHN